MKIDGVGLEILKLLSEGKTVKEISKEIEVPYYRTVKIIYALRLLYGAKNTTELVCKAMKQESETN